MSIFFKLDAPNELQLVPLRFIEPSKNNVRLFFERESLSALRSVFRGHRAGEKVVLPDAPIIRYVGTQWAPPDAMCTEPRFELLAGARRVTAATLEDVDALPCRIVEMTDEEAYKFILDHNDVAGLTTAELAFRAAEMDRLGFSHDEISEQLGGAAAYRYIGVGLQINPDWFTDTAKLCDPSIVEWYEATLFGPEHFKFCFDHWNQGIWDEKNCAKMFRRRGIALPVDNAEKGFRITFDTNRFVLRGQIDLDIVDHETAQYMLEDLAATISTAKMKLSVHEHFGTRVVEHINPTTV